MKCSLKDKNMITALKQSLGSNCLLVMERTRTNKSNLIFLKLKKYVSSIKTNMS